ncbi:sugar transferase [Granulicella sp. S190]|uniref:sugar transferase n=1 Tax=Granulicella sp. S190 TaxID=1747226 RepID=UPI0020B14A32|nr:sugar transferase [Granulicella sp. S190]
MTPSNRRTLLELAPAGDLGLLFCCLGLSYLATVHQRVFEVYNSLETHYPIPVFLATALLALAWHATLRMNGFYRSRRLEGHLKEALDVCGASSLCAAFTFVWLWLICSHSKHSVMELVVIAVLFGILSLAGFLTTRLVARAIMQAFRARGHNRRYILIVGTNRRANSFVQDIARHPEWGYCIQGFVDDQWWSKQTADSQLGALVGGLDSIPELLRTLPVDEIIVALPLASFYQQIAGIISACRDHGIAVRFLGTFFDQEDSKRTAFLRGAVGTITLHDESWNAWAFMVKRTADVVISFVMLVLLAPLFVMIAALIKLTAPGPVFFKQTRMGYGKRPFEILKFRTMVQDAERLMSQVEHLNETQGPTFKLKNDPRITPAGKFLRKTSLDEIPQLINVLVGDMSLVGPRPLPLRDYEGFEQDWHRRRFSVKPGITCLWQIMGRSSIGFDEWMALDMRYIDQWSVWLDIKILCQTIPAVFRGSGAV